MELYLARRYLGLSPAEYDALPWWERRLYLEGFREERLVNDGSGSSAPSGSSPSEPAENRVLTDLSGAQSGEFARMGFRERTVIPMRQSGRKPGALGGGAPG